MLKKMKRLYTVAEYREMLGRIRDRVPRATVSSDFIVGFCGESEASFQKTMELTHEAKFKNSFIFKYSERPGTKAAERYPDDIPEEVKKRRNNDLLAVQNANSLADHRAQIGKTVSVLVEGLSKRAKSTGNHHQLTGRSMTDHIVVFDAPERLIGQIVDVDIQDASSFTLYGRVNVDSLQDRESLSIPTPRRRSLELL
jgi:tRNA-2-methylthio-N6-dimethylallyladenosine synthase